MIDSAMDAIISINMEQKIILFNAAAERMFRHSAKDMIGQPLERLLPERYRANHASHIRHFGETGVTTRTMGSLQSLGGIRANGEEFPIEASISQIEINGQKILTVILRDITERKQVEDTLRESEARFSKVFQASPVGINIFRLSDNCSVNANDAFLDTIGYALEEVIGRSGAELNLFVDPNVRDVWMQTLRANGWIKNYETKIRRKSSEIRDVLTSIDIISLSGEPMGLVVTIDITERKQAEENLRAAEIKYRIMVEHIPAIIYLT